MSLKPICVKCQRFYRPKKNGYGFIEAMPIGGFSAPAGTSCPELWTPYKLWRGDLWECQGCGHELVSGVANQPISEHYKPDFKMAVETFSNGLQVNDC
jgi:hypothetical protein